MIHLILKKSGLIRQLACEKMKARFDFSSGLAIRGARSEISGAQSALINRVHRADEFFLGISFGNPLAGDLSHARS